MQHLQLYPSLQGHPSPGTGFAIMFFLLRDLRFGAIHLNSSFSIYMYKFVNQWRPISWCFSCSALTVSKINR